MTETIWKTVIVVDDEQKVTLPIRAQPLCVLLQRGDPCIWWKVDPESETRTYRIFVYVTGHKYKKIQGEYIGTIQDQGRKLVWHVFYEP